MSDFFKKTMFPILGILLCAFPAAAGGRRTLSVFIHPVQGAKDVFLLHCSVEEHTEKRNASSTFTTRLPVLPMRLGKWAESIYVLPGAESPLRTIRLKGAETFTFPLAGISRKALLEPDPDFPGEYHLSLYWYDGKASAAGEFLNFRIWTVVSLKPGKQTVIGIPEEK